MPRAAPRSSASARVRAADSGFAAFRRWLRRALRHLNRTPNLPRPVRAAFDTLTEAVLVLDAAGRVMLANHALARLVPGAGPIRAGADVAELEWLVGALRASDAPPWEQVFETDAPVRGLEIRVGAGGAAPRDVVLNCLPLHDAFGRTHACLVTMSDVTELHERTEGLRLALAELHASREEIRLKNEELTLLATRDALTGCLNRRALLAEGERCVAAAAASGAPLCVIMADIDHFKSVNDRFGHGGGDAVLRAVVKTLDRCLRFGDLLGRQGGEEFCIVLPGATLAQAREVAERLRGQVEAHAGSAVRHLADVQVTMSFGVEQLGPQAPDFAALVDRADQALYRSKQRGRNQVSAWVGLDAAPAPHAG